MRALGFLLVGGWLAAGIQASKARKAESLAKRIELERPAEYHYEMAQLAERKKQYAAAGQHLRSAMSLAPGDARRLLDFARAETDIETRRHSEEARKLLRQYIASDRTPDNPPQQGAEKLLYQIQGD